MGKFIKTVLHLFRPSYQKLKHLNHKGFGLIVYIPVSNAFIFFLNSNILISRTNKNNFVELIQT